MLVRNPPRGRMRGIPDDKVASFGIKSVWESQPFVAETDRTELLMGTEFYSRVSFYLCWLFPARVYECVSVCLYVDVSCAVCVTWMDSWGGKKKKCPGRFQLSHGLDSYQTLHLEKNKNKKKQSLNWCMTCVAFCHRERLSWFVQRYCFVTVLILL